jgi:hypothetical protein
MTRKVVEGAGCKGRIRLTWNSSYSWTGELVKSFPVLLLGLSLSLSSESLFLDLGSFLIVTETSRRNQVRSVRRKEEERR